MTWDMVYLDTECSFGYIRTSVKFENFDGVHLHRLTPLDIAIKLHRDYLPYI
jgi:hypothetical protein